MFNPYLNYFPFLSEQIHRSLTHFSGHTPSLLIASTESLETRIWFESALVWDIADCQTVMRFEIELNAPLTPILDAAEAQNYSVPTQLLSIALNVPKPPKKETAEFEQWQQNVCAWFDRLNREREAIARQQSPILLWLPAETVPDFVQNANDLWSWRSDFLELSFPRNFTTNLPFPTDLTVVQKLAKTTRSPIPTQLEAARDFSAQQAEMAQILALDIPEVVILQNALRNATDDSFVHAIDEHRYLHWLIERNEYLDPRGTFQTQRQVQLKLDEIYIGLRAQADERPSDADRKMLERELAELDERLVESGLSAEEQEDRRDSLMLRLNPITGEHISRNRTPIPLAEATVQHERLVILGDPGSGKTTLLRYLAYQHAQAIQNDAPTVRLERAARKQNATQSTVQDALFPILIRIADYAEQDTWKDASLDEFLPTYFQQNDCRATGLAALLTTRLQQGGCLILLDGLDEIVDADDRRGIVQQIENFVRTHDRGGPNGPNRFIITSRIAGYRSASLGEPFAHFVVEEMDESQMQHFLDRWCRAVEDVQTPDLSESLRQSTAQREVENIMQAIRETQGVRRLASNPLMLRTLALIHRTGARLPQKRIELYKLAADTLARTWRTAQGVPATVLVEDHFLTPMLGQLAYWMHEHKPTGIATEREVYAQLGAAFAKRQRIEDFDPDDPPPEITQEIDNFLLAVREHAGLFVERAPKRYGFMHLTFEEYYAARHLVARSRTRAQMIRKHLHDPRWEEPILLALGFVGLDYPDEAAELLDTAILAWGDEAEELGFEPSKYEELLGRDYLFALRVLGDHFPANPITIDNLAERLITELAYQRGLTGYRMYKAALSERFADFAGSSTMEILVEKLLSALKDDSIDVRSQAALRLGRLEESNSDIINALIGVLDDDSHVRYQAALSLSNLGEINSDVINALIDALKDSNMSVSVQAALSIGLLLEVNYDVTTALTTTLMDDNNPVTFLLAVSSLEKLGKINPDVIDALMTALTNALISENSFRHYLAASSLLELAGSNSDAVNVLIGALKNDNSTVRSTVALTLGQLRETSKLTYSEVISALINTLKDNNPDVRSAVAVSLGQLGEANANAVNALTDAIRDDNKSVCAQAAGSLVQLGEIHPDVIDTLINTLKDDDINLRARAAESLVQLGEINSEVIDVITSLLLTGDTHARSRATESLVQLGEIHPGIINMLTNTLKNDDISVRSRAAESLVQLGEVSPSIINTLTNTLKNDDISVCSRAAESLIKLGKINPEVIAALLSTLKGAGSYIARRNAAQQIEQIGDSQQTTLDELKNGLLDPHEGVRKACASALAKIGARFPQSAEKIEEMLVQAIVDPAFEVRDEHQNRTAQDYAHEALWQLVNR